MKRAAQCGNHFLPGLIAGATSLAGFSEQGRLGTNPVREGPESASGAGASDPGSSPLKSRGSSGNEPSCGSTLWQVMTSHSFNAVANGRLYDPSVARGYDVIRELGESGGSNRGAGSAAGGAFDYIASRAAAVSSNSWKAGIPGRAARDPPLKRLVVFDLDGTLAESKSAIDSEMSGLLAALLGVVKVAIISGGDLPQFEKQVIARLEPGADLAGLSLLPTCGTRFFQYRDGWHKLYSEDLTGDQKRKIEAALEAAVAATGFGAAKTWGEVIEDRESQITYSALGQQAPLDAKKTWDPDFTKRQKIKALLDVSLPDFSVRLGGTTSIDVTLPGIDKAYGIGKLRDILGIPVADMIYVGDALFPGGNDYPARSTGVVCIQVRDPDETKRVIETVVACLQT